MNCVAATVVAVRDPEASYALIDDAVHVAFLQQECRIYGSPEGTVPAASSMPRRLRLSLEELAVGVTNGFLRLEASTSSSSGNELIANEGQTQVQEITQELMGVGQFSESSESVTWRLSPQRHARLRVFRDLWERGYTVTFGSKFGADFLIYKDDPKRAHAVALIVVKGYKEEFARVDVVSFCRVAKMVKKQLMFACVRRCEERVAEEAGAATDSVVYISLSHALLVSRQEECDE
ncbi:tRNA-splicing endonuclease subunit Sen34 [Phytophthora ramorum]|uniref:tRNA-splicing endonuclease subunit Sen34 n=1 Tax=Phytophthora ramorum TaxID=164328 RepID=UPI003098199F|nr:tRNA-splicing endonuclease subunit Sen34 [Phytophthora ramorum]